MMILLTVSAALALQQATPPMPVKGGQIVPASIASSLQLVPAALPPPTRTAFFGSQEAPAPVAQEDAYMGVLLDVENGRVVIGDVIEGTGADSGGLEDGDVIIMAGGVRIEGAGDLLEAIEKTGVGGSLSMVILRDGQPAKLDVVLGSRTHPIAAPPAELVEPGEPVAPAPEPRPFLGVSLGQADGGALITSSISDTAAGQAGLLAGDLVTRFNGNAVESAADLIDAVGSSEAGEVVLLEVMRDGDALLFEIELGTRQQTASISEGFFAPDQPGEPGRPVFPGSGPWVVGGGSDFTVPEIEDWAEFEAQWAAVEQDWLEEFGGEWSADYEGEWTDHLSGEWADEFGEWTAEWSDEVNEWAEHDWEELGESMDNFSDEFEMLGQRLEQSFEAFGEQLEGSLEHFAERMEHRAERLGERLAQRSDRRAGQLERRIERAPRPERIELVERPGHGRGQVMQAYELEVQLDRMAAERDAARKRAEHLEQELNGVRHEVAELRSEVRELIRHLEEMRSDS